MSRNIRQTALAKLVALSATSQPGTLASSDIDRLSEAVSKRWQGVGSSSKIPEGYSGISSVPMGLRELEVLLALCRASPLVEDTHKAGILLQRLSPYMLEVSSQAFEPSPFLRSVEPSPWEVLSLNLSSAILAIGHKHQTLRQSALDCLSSFLAYTLKAINGIVSAQTDSQQSKGSMGCEECLRVAMITVSILGFLKAAAAYPDVWNTTEKLQILDLTQQILSESALLAVETALSTIRNSHATYPGIKDWRRYMRCYAGIGQPLGAMLLQCTFMRLVLAISARAVTKSSCQSEQDVLTLLSQETINVKAIISETDESIADTLTEIATRQMGLLEDGADFLRLGSAWQQRLAFAIKASALTVFLICTLLDEQGASGEVLISWLDDTIGDSVQMSDEKLASVVLQSMAILAKVIPGYASTLGRSLPRYIVQGMPSSPTIAVAANCLSSILQLLSEDAVISALYTLGIVLSSKTGGERIGLDGASLNGSINGQHHDDHNAIGSAISLAVGGQEELSLTYGNVIQAVAGIASSCNDDKITALAQSMLMQKYGKVNAAVDARLITESAKLAVIGGSAEFRSLLRQYSKICHDSVVQGNQVVLSAILKARNFLSLNLELESPLYDIYFAHLLENIVSKGDVQDDEGSNRVDFELVAEEIAQLLPPLALLVSSSNLTSEVSLSEETLSLSRDAWFNLVVHGFSTSSGLGRRYSNELRRLAFHLRPLTAGLGMDQPDSDVELNTVLLRGMTNHRTGEQKRLLAIVLPNCEPDIRGLSYPKLIFLRAVHLMETMRAELGDCAAVLTYFADSNLSHGAMGNCMAAICEAATKIYIENSLQQGHSKFASPNVAKQLSAVFMACCHRAEEVQHMAILTADRIIRAAPSALCHRTSLFVLLELLTMMLTSCLETETEEYEWQSHFASSKGEFSIELSDDYALRLRTLNTLYKNAKAWVVRVIGIAPLDVKGLLQMYLSEYDDRGSFGNVALGRSFASEMGSAVPYTDKRLIAIDCQGDFNVSVASDFIAQYTLRQEYRHERVPPDRGDEAENNPWPPTLQRSSSQSNNQSNNDANAVDALLGRIERKFLEERPVSYDELRCALRQAAALLCRVKDDDGNITHRLVAIPFTIFTKQSIDLGVTFWMGVINENPKMESRIMAEVLENWENTVRRAVGMFDKRLHHKDPFYIKEEFAPSNKEALLRRQQFALKLIGPHTRLLQFLVSRFNATRLGSLHNQKPFHRLVRNTLEKLKRPVGHPLTREVHFQFILFSLDVLKYSSDLETSVQWRLKDQILSAALGWFAVPSRWSFGSDRLQVKAEIHILAEVESALQSGITIGSTPTGLQKSLQEKQDLLLLLLKNEQARLMVWLHPLEHNRKHHLLSSNHERITISSNLLPTYLRSAWAQSPALAIQLFTRFPSAALASNLRWLLLNFPEKAVDEADALNVLLGNHLPGDLTFQLKYLLYWAPVDPITAVTYFLPAYGNHPFILQYAMRALESHSIDVTFFYVPQIVQTLRYDVLGYVEQYIIETAKFSQLFAHQIIWNMKANAYRDEDSQVPDSIKPILDKVMESLISSFSGPDEAFYRREFTFFAEITEISGKLRPFIKRSKAEKKQKIEEELRKIKVEVGVYLPSNPDGVVIGIDRKSGKPLQSHAKAPYMATFRIKKDKSDMEGAEQMLGQVYHDSSLRQENTMELWQSAIFKVGDDCRQDVLALQLIAAFRGIFDHAGLDVYVYPYRVTATAPGCGVIDVLPNTISRDMLGREAVNGLYDYFVSKYGGEKSVRFQEARSNFVKSMAAYSVISYLLQFKDRHNGNIMIDDAGHILHIDFGFCFDIAPGGIKFERAPFKLTSEMVAVMGGSTESQSYHWFESLCIKAFLASRPYAEKLIRIVLPMLDSGLPCFKPETIKHFRERFVLEKSEREAAEFMKDLIKKSYGSYSTKGYDQFQLMTNGIPY